MARRRRRRKKITFAERCREEALALPERLVPARCEVASACGGCTWQDIDYALQLEFKERFIRDSFEQAGLEVATPTPVGSPEIFGHRNTMEYSFSARRWLTREEIESGAEIPRDFALGLHVPGGFDRVLDVPSCPVQGDAPNRVLQVAKDFARSSGRPAYHKVDHTGFWRYLRLRRGANTDQTLVQVVTTERDEELMARFVETVVAAEPTIVTVANGVTASVADTSEGAEVFVDHGPGFYEEIVDGLTFRISPTSFFQPNTNAAAILFGIVVDLAGLTGEERVLDLFCGTGTLALHLARRAREVVGVELSEVSVQRARENAERNGIEGVRFEVADLEKGLAGAEGAFDVVVTDPPRGGMHKKAIAELLALAPRRIVSVGCNPKTQAENLASLCERGPYEIAEMRAVDQFPHTPHVENVALLVRSDG